MNKATVGFDKHPWLKISKEGHAPLLLLEWISIQNTKWTIKVEDTGRGHLLIRLINGVREQYGDCRDYINNNL